MASIPKSVTHADLMAALEPLNALLGVTKGEVFMGGLMIHPTIGEVDCVAGISVVLAARGEGDRGDRPKSIRKAVGVSTAPADNAELAWICFVKVV